MAEKKPVVLYAASYDSVSAALADLDAIEQTAQGRDDRLVRRGGD
jgi:hypothetical protein